MRYCSLYIAVNGQIWKIDGYLVFRSRILDSVSSNVYYRTLIHVSSSDKVIDDADDSNASEHLQ